MKKGFYRMLAWTGIRQNKKLYLPYLLTCMGTVMMCYIISFLSTSPVFGSIKGGNTMQSFLSMGVGVMGVFSLIFLFYTNSFLIRRRKKEFGLYNILGLGKKNLALVLVWETLMMAALTIGGGLFFGILFSKLAELCMVRILGGTASFAFTVEVGAVIRTVLLFAGIFALIFLNTLRQIQLTNPIQLLRSENLGEKPPRANWLVALLGAVLLGGAYYLAVTVEDPLSAVMIFFVAVVMVVIATYMLFMAGSVTLCRLLQKNKRYYYKTSHFVSVSSMSYRMKRNGAGLASICILCTMVLVMVSSTVCLYLGAEDSLRNRYPRNLNLDISVSSTELLDGAETAQTQELVEQVVTEYGTQQENILMYRTASLGGLIQGNQIIFGDETYANRMDLMGDLWQVFIVPLSDYNRLMGKEETLAPGEVLIYTTKEMSYDQDTIRLGDGEALTVKKHAEGFVDNGVDSMQIFPTLYLFVPDFETVVAPLEGLAVGNGGLDLVSLHWYYAFDLPCDDDTQVLIHDRLNEALIGASWTTQVSIEGVARERADFYGIYGGLFFLGILLGVAFLFAAVLIIYYKQVSEGYEDQARFAIMQKVGMTRKEIRQSINAQILTVFFMPLVTAGVHLAFAFPIIRRLLMMFGVTNTPFLVGVTVCCYLVFALFYVVVYRMTSRSYYGIVSGMQQDS